jgi:uncharacterized protein YgiM (DUF1202 family)
MKKKSLIFLTLFSFFVFSQKHIATSDLNIRDKPNTNSNVLKVINQGETISIDSLGEKWSRIVLENGENAYVSSKFIQKSNTSNSNSKDLTILYIILGVLFVAYIIALVKSRNNKMVAIAGWSDLALLAAPLIGFVIIMIFGLLKKFQRQTNKLFGLYTLL